LVYRFARSPNTLSSAGHAFCRAVTLSPSLTRPFSSSALLSPWVVRWTQYVHFSMTPRHRTVTSGLASIRRLGARNCFDQWKKLNRRTLEGQVFEQYLVPTQRL